MSDDTNIYTMMVVVFAMLFAVAMFFSGYKAGIIRTERRYQHEAIEVNAAEYDTETGEWRWKVQIGQE